MPKFALITTQVEEFESQEGIEHFIKEHSPLDFDQKVELLEKRKLVVADLEDDTVTTIEIATEFLPGDGEQPATETVKDETTEKPGEEKGTDESA